MDGMCGFHKSGGGFPFDKMTFLEVLWIKHIILIVQLFFKALLFFWRQAEALAFGRWKAGLLDPRVGLFFHQIKAESGEFRITVFKPVGAILVS